MTYPQFEEDLYGIYKSEIMGEALFSVAALVQQGDVKLLQSVTELLQG